MQPDIEQQIDAWFTYHAPSTKQVEQYAALREQAKTMAHAIANICPPCADRTVALRKLRECVMTANASIACNGA